MAERRIGALDVLRGVAILGTLGTNIWIFTDPGGIIGFLARAPGTAELVLQFLTNGKFLGLLSLLFGVGMELQYQSAARRGARWPGWYLWRAGLLLIEGALHFVLVFEGDVLMAYALTSVVVAYLIGRSDRAVRAVMVVVAVVQMTLLSLGTLVILTATGTQDDAAVFGDPAVYSAGGYLDQVLARLDHALLYRLELVIIVPLGLITTLLFGARGAPGRCRGGLAAVGRTALSCYVFQNVAASALCYGWGSGFGAAVGRLPALVGDRCLAGHLPDAHRTRHLMAAVLRPGTAGAGLALGLSRAAIPQTTLPGFRIPWGSRACLIAAITSIASPCSSRINRALP